MNGIICVDKPTDFTSFDVVAKLRGIFGQRKIGHGGTLDPFATGVLPIFLGKATRVCDILPVDTKAYRVGIDFGYATDTLDCTGEVTERIAPDFTKEQLEEAIGGFIGDISQIPPMYSAIKIGGRKLYDIARSGKVVERPARNVTIFSIDLLDFDPEKHVAQLEVSCSKGTYIRTLADDLGKALGTLATVSSLRRVRSGLFGESDCYTLQQLQEAKDNGTLEALVRPLDCVFAPMEKLILPDGSCRKLFNGLTIGTQAADGTYAVYGETVGFLGLCTATDKVLKVDKNFAEEAIRG